MAEKKKVEQSKIDALYQWLSYDLQKLREELMNEMKISSTQIGYLYKGLKGDKDNASTALEHEIRYSYKQNQNIYEGLATLLKTEVAERLTSMDEKMNALEKVEALLNDVSELKYSYMQLQALCEGISQLVSGDVISKLDEIVNEESMKSLVEESVSVHSQKITDAIAAIPAPETVDYDRISEEVGDKLLEILNEVKANEEALAAENACEDVVDYERIAGDTAAKVIESMPYPDQIDYNHIDESVANAVADLVNVDALAEAVAAKIVLPTIEAPAAPEVDYDRLAEAVAAKIVLPTIEAPAAPEVDYDRLAELVVDKLTAKGISADVVLDEEGISKIADTVAEKVGPTEVNVQAPEVDYDRVAVIVEEAIVKSCDDMEKVVALDDEGIEKIVDGVAEELRNMTLVCEYLPEEEEAPVEEIVEEVVEEAPVEEVVEEVVEEAPVEEVVEEVVEEAPVEEIVEEVVEEVPVEEPVQEVETELAVSAEPVYEEDLDGQLIDAETGLVVRLKRSFTAKMKQSEQQVKVYYSDIKNALTSYKRINSNVSWHGDRFNFGRETVAKIGINGKTLCFYLALDPNDPELKTTVYHQKDVGAQKAYESTPFMVKVKSDAASKKALRLVGILANKLGAEQDEAFEEVDYVAQFAYESTKRLFEEGDIKATKEKKVDFNF